MKRGYTATGQMVVSAAREIKEGDIIYVGVGLPTLATWLAKFTHAPNCTVVHEVGIIRTTPSPLGQFQDALPVQTMSDSLAGLFYVNALAQRGFVNAGFIGAGQIDRYGNVNDTAAGNYLKPVHRWPGSGGANDVMSFCKRVSIIMKQNKRRFPEKVDFVTCPGYLDGDPEQRLEHGLLPNTGPSMVITDMGIYTFEEREMTLNAFHADLGITLQDVKAEIGWDIKISQDLRESEPPGREELSVLREKVDPGKIFVDGKFAFQREQE
jgi:acyl CoA:acetate/3-ketoacid CoA transferase beta subunit